MTYSDENNMELKAAVIACLNESDTYLTHINIFYTLVLTEHISKKDRTFSKIKEIREICESLAKEGVLIEKEGKFGYNKEYKTEIIAEPIKINNRLKKPEISRNQINDIAVIIGFIIFYALFYYYVTALDTTNDGSQKLQTLQSELQKNATLTSPETIEIPISVPTSAPNVTLTPVVIEPKSYSIKIDVSHGFYPDVITINKSDIIIWYDEEDQRPRIVLLSKDGLFENRLMQYHDRYKYQFNQQGKYTFNLAEYPSNKEYNNTMGNVIVN